MRVAHNLRRKFCNTAALFMVIVPLAARAAGEAPEAAAPRDGYPKAASKKGLQVELVEDALRLGVKHAALNVNLSALVAPDAHAGQEGVLVAESGGQEFCFRRAPVEALDRRVRDLSDAGVLVNLIILAYEPRDQRVKELMLHPGYDDQAPNRLGAFNTATELGRAWYSATLGMLAERYSRPDRRHGTVVGYIIGNEVNSHWWWSNMGRVSMHQFADAYAVALRLAHRAVRQHNAWARVYVSLEHHWNVRFGAGDAHQSFAGKPFLEYLAHRLRDDPPGDFDWHLAFHPYPENLFDPKFWEDETAPQRADAARVTFRNLTVLTEHLSRPEMLHQGRRRRVILSEQGFHTPPGPEGEALQAAAYCYAYRLVDGIEGIDAFILHRHVDHPNEGGLLLGLRANKPGSADPRPPKRIYECFRLADTPEWERAFRFALPIVGLNAWPSTGVGVAESAASDSQ